MPWSAQNITPVAAIASLAKKVGVQQGGAGNFSFGGTNVTPVAATAALGQKVGVRKVGVPAGATPVAAQASPAGATLNDAPRVIPAAAPVQTINPTASQRTDAEPVQTMGVGTQNRAPRAAIADTSALPSVNRLAARVGQTAGLKDPKLGSRSPSTAPSAFNLMQTSTFKTPYAPEFLTNAVAGLNETQSYTSLMHDEWRNRLLSESEGRPDLLPALTAASVQSGAHFSYAAPGGGVSSAGATQRQPSYWEQKLAMTDYQKAIEKERNARNQYSQLGGITSNAFLSPADRIAEENRMKGEVTSARWAQEMAQRVMGYPGIAGTQETARNDWNRATDRLAPKTTFSAIGSPGGYNTTQNRVWNNAWLGM